MISPNKISWWSIAGKVGVFLMGLAVLAVSITQTSLKILAIDEVRNRLIQFDIVNDDGTVNQGSYKLPEVGVLPDNPFYGIKRIRDWMWLKMTTEKDRGELILFLADKKMSEVVELVSKERIDLAIETGKEAMIYLEYADSVRISQLSNTDEDRRLGKQLFTAGLAYDELFEKYVFVGENYIDSTELKQTINDWNEKQKAKRWQWD